MRIGFNFYCADDYISGVEYYSLGLLRSLLDIDRQNLYIVFTNKPEIITFHIGPHNNLIIKGCGFLKTRFSRIIWEHLRLPGIARKEKLDILHCPHYICPVFRSSAPYVVTVHDTIAIDNPKFCKKTNAAYYNIFMKPAVSTAVKIITVSNFTSGRLCENFGVNSSKVNVIYPGIDEIFNTFQNTERLKDVQIKYNLPEKFILYCGNIEPKKNILNLLRAFKLLKLKNTKCRLVITGKRTWKSRKVWNYIQSDFYNEEIVTTGYIERQDLPWVYKSAACLVSTSYYEGFGFSPLEAFACRVPVAATCTGILKEINKQAYTLLEPQSPIQISEAIYKLISDDRRKEEQIKSALSEVKRFNWADCAAKTLSLYEQAVETNG